MLSIFPDTERLARLVANKTGRSPEEVIHTAVEASAREAGLATPAARDIDPQALIEAARKIAARSADRTLLDSRTDDEVLGYDSHGIAR